MAKTPDDLYFNKLKKTSPHKEELQFQSDIVKAIEQLGGIALYLEPTKKNKWFLPDFLVSLFGEMFLMEVKKPLTGTRASQDASFEILNKYFPVYICHSWADLAIIVNKFKHK